MNANSTPQTQKYKDWLQNASSQLKNVGINSYQLDAELILSNALCCDRTFLHAHSDDLITAKQLHKAENLLQKRLNREPIAYLIGKKEFYGRDFIVTHDTLIPRPESEQIIDFLIELYPSKTTKYKFVDIGTGTGCLGVTIKKELPESDVTLVDISPSALEIARKNTALQEVSVNIQVSDLLESVSGKFDAIIANLPYVDINWERSPETQYEPSLALYAKDNGIELIKKLLLQSQKSLKQAGRIFIECDNRQHDIVTKFAESIGYILEKSNGLILVFIYQN